MREIFKNLSHIRHLNYNVFLLAACLGLSQACSHKPPAEVPDPKAVPANSPAIPNSPLVLKLVGEMGREEVTKNCSVSVTTTYADGQIQRKKVEGVDFDVKTSTTHVDKKGNLTQNVQILSKDGYVDLHDLAYPELGEKMDMTLTPDAQVKKAGRYPKTSIFYVQTIPLVTKAVKPGDEWEAESSWLSDTGGVELKSKMNVKFAGWKTCGDHVCAEIVSHGDVHMPPKVEKRNGFVHKLSGRFLFDPARGLVTWSEFASDEQLQAEGARAVVHSVLRSYLVEPHGYHTANREEPACPLETKEE